MKNTSQVLRELLNIQTAPKVLTEKAFEQSNYNKNISNFYLFQHLDVFKNFLDSRFQISTGDKTQHYAGGTILIILFLIEAKLRNESLTGPDVEVFIQRYHNGSPQFSRFDSLAKLREAGVIIPDGAIIKIAPAFFAELQQGESEVKLKLLRTGQPTTLNLAVLIGKLLKDSKELRALALHQGLKAYVGVTQTDSEIVLPMQTSIEETAGPLMQFSVFQHREDLKNLLFKLPLPEQFTKYDKWFLFKNLIKFLLFIEIRLENSQNSNFFPNLDYIENLLCTLIVSYLPESVSIAEIKTSKSISNIEFPKGTDTYINFKFYDINWTIKIDHLVEFLINFTPSKIKAAYQFNLGRYIDYKKLSKTPNLDEAKLPREILKKLADFLKESASASLTPLPQPVHLGNKSIFPSAIHYGLTDFSISSIIPESTISQRKVDGARENPILLDDDQMQPEIAVLEPQTALSEDNSYMSQIDDQISSEILTAADRNDKNKTYELKELSQNFQTEINEQPILGKEASNLSFEDLCKLINKIKDGVEEISLLNQTDKDKLYIVLIFIAAYSKQIPINVATCCELLKSNDGKRRTHRTVSTIEGILLSEGIIETNSNYQNLTFQFLASLENRQPKLFVTISKTRTEIPLQALISEIFPMPFVQMHSLFSQNVEEISGEEGWTTEIVASGKLEEELKTKRKSLTVESRSEKFPKVAHPRNEGEFQVNQEEVFDEFLFQDVNASSNPEEDILAQWHSQIIPMSRCLYGQDETYNEVVALREKVERLEQIISGNQNNPVLPDNTQPVSAEKATQFVEDVCSFDDYDSPNFFR